MRRTWLAVLLSVSFLTVPLIAEGQQTGAPQRVGFLLVGLTPESSEAQHFRNGLRDAGYAEGRSVVIEWRSARGGYDRVPDLITAFLLAKVDRIVVGCTVRRKM